MQSADLPALAIIVKSWVSCSCAKRRVHQVVMRLVDRPLSLVALSRVFASERLPGTTGKVNILIGTTPAPVCDLGGDGVAFVRDGDRLATPLVLVEIVDPLVSAPDTSRNGNSVLGVAQGRTTSTVSAISVVDCD